MSVGKEGPEIRGREVDIGGSGRLKAEARRIKKQRRDGEREGERGEGGEKERDMNLTSQHWFPTP